MNSEELLNIAVTATEDKKAEEKQPEEKQPENKENKKQNPEEKQNLPT